MLTKRTGRSRPPAFQPDDGLYLTGMKSYGRAPSFLAMTGFEQVRSIVAKIDGNDEAAKGPGWLMLLRLSPKARGEPALCCCERARWWHQQAAPSTDQS